MDLEIKIQLIIRRTDLVIIMCARFGFVKWCPIIGIYFLFLYFLFDENVIKPPEYF